MSIRIIHDAHAPTASVELMITRPLEDYDLIEIEAPTPRDVDPMLASQGFKDLIDEARAILEREFADHGLKIEQLTGAICHDNGAHRPGIWIVVRETGSEQNEMSSEARARVAGAAESVRTNLGTS
ncbi:MAG TPA: hypothetical protein VGR81_09790 [Candidatus Acidoferrales bacterium]|nr:hypothetical protein [Candidatus Acidoferrales bacterium]